MNELFFSYVPGRSFLHRLDPRTKLISIMLLSIVVLRASDLQDIVVLFGVFLVFSLPADLGIRHHFKALRPLLLFFLFIFLVQSMSSEGEYIFSMGMIGISYEGIWKGVLVTSRFILLVLFASILISTTSPAFLSLGIERMLRLLPLSLLGISSHDLSIMMSISMRFVPLLHMNFEQIVQAQVSRGMDLRRHPLKGVSSLMVPMVHSTLRMAEDISMAMESRCYQGIYRTSMFELKMRKEDIFSLLIVMIFVILFFHLQM
ncbi:energy-coupling factor transporter transmembrane protein EcfT [Methanomethylovorans sp.]|uniref:energy-coupling factor transporter transmembrane component T family protein n=1 Tax=Methanomethylovorans sp. TaxID=2758717 RepID=UPI000B1C5A95|nr:energy-coupling factor transporter transmembrane component T [Methanomethylovorans sp.]